MYTRTRIVRVLILSTVDPYKNLAYLRLSPPLASSLYPLWLGTKLGNFAIATYQKSAKSRFIGSLDADCCGFESEVTDPLIDHFFLTQLLAPIDNNWLFYTQVKNAFTIGNVKMEALPLCTIQKSISYICIPLSSLVLEKGKQPVFVEDTSSTPSKMD